ncbi:RNI-like protein [Dioscorea alata]|uniref:RNI-like protein n=1 Tax=Dioscorea alata TaxID=55571 RepID=A0ACB7WDT5_DIOAL|nr:RNI-like protein [Dioscorea alata]
MSRMLWFSIITHYLNCPELNDLNLNSCTNLHPERLLLQCPNLENIHASGCQDSLIGAIEDQVFNKLNTKENQLPSKRLADGSKRAQEMEIPEAYIESLPKNGRASLGDALYKSITVDYFDPEEFLSSIDLSSEHKILDLKNKIEASVVIWKRKMHNKDSKSPWGSAVSLEKREQFEDRAETILLILKHRFPGIPQSSLDISKIQYNKDVGQSILESYSRVIESLGYTVMSRIDDVLYADLIARDPSLLEQAKKRLSLDVEPVKVLDAKLEIEKLNNMEGTQCMTLFDFMGWQEDQEAEVKSDNTTT